MVARAAAHRRDGERNAMLLVGESPDAGDAPRGALSSVVSTFRAFPPVTGAVPWTVLVAAGDLRVTNAARRSLQGLSFAESPLRVLGVHSVAEMLDVLRRPVPVALLVLRLPFCRGEGGAALVQRVRACHLDPSLRIVLVGDDADGLDGGNSGAAGGLADDLDSLDSLDIDDCRGPEVFTGREFPRLVMAALRRCRKLRLSEARVSDLERSRTSVFGLLETCTGLISSRSIPSFTSEALGQLGRILGMTAVGMLGVQRKGAPGSERLQVVSAGGVFGRTFSHTLSEVPDVVARQAVTRAMDNRVNVVADGRITVLVGDGVSDDMALHFTAEEPLDERHHGIVESFGRIFVASLLTLGRFEQMQRANRAISVALATLAEHKDSTTGQHVMRVARMSEEIAQVLRRQGGFPEVGTAFCEYVGMASLHHDIGKLTISEEILSKPGPLSDEERAIMQRHAQDGGEVLRRAAALVEGSRYLELSADIAFAHHEFYDGSGYPRGIKGPAIPLAARIVAVSDVYDALTSQRPYKPAWPEDRAIEYVRSKAGTQFDPLVVEAFLEVTTGRKASEALTWTDAMSVGHPDIDRDHQALCALINQLVHAEGRHCRDTVGRILDELAAYVAIHFEREEAYMRAGGFPGLTAHIAIHRSLTLRVAEVRSEFLSGFHYGLGNTVLDFLTTWLMQHILKEDKSFFRFFAASGHPQHPPGITDPL
jgi:hemerythrin-like metal-binding protein